MQTDLVDGHVLTAIRRHVESHGDAPALALPDRIVTRAQLWTSAAGLAQQLVDRSSGHPDRVLLVATHGPEAVVGMLASWMAGCSVVPIDPGLPTERMRSIVAQAAPTVLLRGEGVGMANGVDLPEARIDIRPSGESPASDLPTSTNREAYVIFTSGSTGRPKGVSVSHAALAEHSLAMADYLGLTGDDTVLQFASPSFDVAMEEMWPTLLAGGSLAFRPPGEAPAPDQLLDLCISRGVTLLQIPTAYWRAFSQLLAGAHPPGGLRVHTVVIGSEAASVDDARAHFDSPLRGCRLVNGYGPTECVITASAFGVDRAENLPDDVTGLPLGEAIGARELVVLGEGAENVGELLIAGSPLADGYLGESPDRGLDDGGRFTTLDDGRRAYRTGDLVRRTASGTLEFVGRVDNQVKVRGYRIELGDVESALRRFDDIVDVAAYTTPSPRGGSALWAAVIPRHGTGLDLQRLTADLAAHLPSYAVPTLREVTAFPLTVSGKVDRAALSVDNHHGRSRDASSIVLADGEAGELQTIVGELLGAPIGVDEDIFDHGADSLLTMQLVAAARERGLRLDARLVLTHRSCADMALNLLPAPGPHASEAMPATAEVALLPAQARWLHDGEIIDPDHFWLGGLYDVPQAVREMNVLQAAAEALSSRHETLGLVLERERLVLRRREGAPTAGVVVPSTMLPRPDDEEALKNACQKIAAGIDLEDGPIWRLGVVYAEERSWLFLAVHHFLVDGLSMTSLTQDLDRFLVDILADRSPAVSSVTEFPVTAFSLATRAWIEGQEAEADACAWARLSRTPPAEVQPALEIEGTPTLDTLATVHARTSAGATRTLLEVLPPLGVYPKDMTLLGIAGALRSWTGEDRHQIDVYAHARDAWDGDVDVTSAAGYFQATYPVQLPACEPTIADILRALEEPACAPPRPWGFDALRFFGPDALREQVAAVPSSQVRLNFRGHLLRLEREAMRLLLPSDESFGRNRSPRQHERYLLMFEGDIDNDALVLSVKFSTVHYTSETVQDLANLARDFIENAAQDATAHT